MSSEKIMQSLERGYSAQQAGQVDTAERLYRSVLDADAQNIHALNLLGMLCVNAFRPQEAVDFLCRALDVDALNPQTHNNIGLAYKDLGDAHEAIRHFQRSIELDDRNPDVYNNLGNVLRVVEKPHEAIRVYERALQLRRDFAECWSNLAAALNEAGDPDAALKAVGRALQLDPDLAQAYNNRGDIFLAQACYEDAVEEYKKAIGLSPKYAAALINMGRTLRDMDRPGDAMEMLEIALELEPRNPEALLVQGVLNEQMGDTDAATSSFKASIESSPQMTVAHYYLAQIKNRPSTETEIADMRRLWDDEDLTPNSRMYLAFGLFRALDRRGDYDEAFAFLAEGNRIKADSTPYDDGDTANYIDSILTSAKVALDRLGDAPGLMDSRPVFVLGMPRSGTSLTEQILASHSEIAGAGELSYAYDMAHRIRAIVNEKFPDNMKLLSADQFTELGRYYLSRHADHNLQSRYVIDKTPLNFQYIGLLALALPEAKFIHCHRDPVANCYSIHRMPFDERQTYAHDLQALGTYYNRYWDMMQAWKGMFPSRILDVRYEDTVADIESQARRMLDFLDLPFEGQLLEFHKTRRLVKTPSASQVRQPIYKDSIRAWKKYEKHLAPLIDSLRIEDSA